MPRALITGITGQDGRYPAELLIGNGYQVHGLIRGQNNPKALIVQDEVPEVELISGDLTDLSSLIAAVEQVQPDEVYNLGAVSFVKLSFSQPELTADVSGSGVLRMLEAIRIVGGSNNRIRFYQAATSEMFGKVHESPQRESTPFHPRSPYGNAKVFGHYTTVNYREAYGIHASNGILFNHTSPRRGIEFVEREITNAAARISLGLQDMFTLGNIDTSRDCGYAEDYVEAMWRECSNKTSPVTTSSPPAGPGRSAKSSTSPSRRSASTTGAPTSPPTTASSGPPRSTSSSATPPTPEMSLDGNRRPSSPRFSKRWSATTSTPNRPAPPSPDRT